MRSELAEISFLKSGFKAEAASPIMVNYDHKMAGEAVTHPKQRVPPLREQHLHKCINGYLEVHNDATALHEADEFVLYCGGKPGLVPALQKPFGKRDKELKAVTLMYARDDIQCRREKTASGSINQIELQLRLTREAPSKPLKQGANYLAWNDGNAIGPIRLPAWGQKDVWMAKRWEKKDIYGPNRFAVGGVGRVVDEHEEDTPASKRARLAASDEEMEPVFFHSAHLHFYEDEVQMGNYSAIVDFTPGQGYLLWVAISAGIPSVGLCMTVEHKQRLLLHLLSLSLQAMSTEGHDHYEPRLEALLKEHGDAELAALVKKPGQPRKSRGFCKAKGKARPRKLNKEKKCSAGSKSEGSEEEKSAEASADEEEEEDKTTKKGSGDPAEKKLLETLKRLNAGKQA